MSRYSPRNTQWESLRTLERIISASTWCLCIGLVWAGVRAWSSGAGIAVMIIALVVCVLAALSLPHVKHAAFRHVVSGGEDLDEEWRLFNRRG